MSDLKPMTVGELRDLIADLPEDAPIFVDGYEGGCDRPVLKETCMKTLEPWVASGSYCGAWSEASWGDGHRAWVLARSEDDR